MTESTEKTVSVLVSDPWDFLDDNGSSIFSAKILDSSNDCLLLCTSQPIIIRSKTNLLEWTRFIGTPRYFSKSIIVDIDSGCHCNLVPLPDSVQTCVDAVQLAEKWRGRGLIAIVTKVVSTSF